MTQAAPLLAVRNLRIGFANRQGVTHVVDDVSFEAHAGQTLAIVGESGCGKSMTALALSRLLPRQARVDGSILLQGQDLLTLPERGMRALRGNRLAMIFQDPMAALNPVMTVGAQIVEAIRAHQAVSATVARRRAQDLLDLVRIPQPARRLDDYPHNLSGGMRQRVAIAIALACDPALLIADEPTTALDVTIQAQILALLNRLQRELGMALILITHDLGVVAETADRVLVMYAGRVVEEQGVMDLFEAPAHPYTRLLMQARPPFGTHAAPARSRLREIPGTVPAAGARVAGCAFRDRCDRASALCAQVDPGITRLSPGARVACHHADTARLTLLHAARPGQAPAGTARPAPSPGTGTTPPREPAAHTERPQAVPNASLRPEQARAAAGARR